METYIMVVTIICMIAYTIFSVWAMKRFKSLSTGIIGGTCLAAGGVGVYLVSSLVASVLLLVLKIIAVIAIIAFALFLFGE